MNIERLYDILAYRRQHGSAGERRMVDEQLAPYCPDVLTDKSLVAAGYFLRIDHPDGTAAKTLFCAHVDTVHHSAPGKPDKVANAFTQTGGPDDPTWEIAAKGDVLGADDGAAVWLLLEMIDAGVPGGYLFHRGEECGGLGSKVISDEYFDLLRQFDRAIAFDRKATHSVITHQRFGRCCSEAFGEALAAALSDDSYFFVTDDGGVFTDTANYIDHIGECTNVSVGYYDEHTTKERLDVKFLVNLRSRCLALDWEALPTKRAAGEKDRDAYSFTPWARRSTTPAAPTLEEVMGYTFAEVEDFLYDNPDEASALLWELLHPDYAGLPGDDPDEADSAQEDDAWETEFAASLRRASSGRY